MGTLIVAAVVVVIVGATAPLGHGGRRRGPRRPAPDALPHRPTNGRSPRRRPRTRVQRAARRRLDVPADGPRRPARSAWRTSRGARSGSTSGRRGARHVRPRRRSCASSTASTAIGACRSSGSASRRRTRPTSRPMPTGTRWATRWPRISTATSSASYRVYGLPTQFFIAPDGRITVRDPGAVGPRVGKAPDRGHPPDMSEIDSEIDTSPRRRRRHPRIRIGRFWAR